MVSMPKTVSLQSLDAFKKNNKDEEEDYGT
jgi:hypothetical protein